jgi:hypothetical protein
MRMVCLGSIRQKNSSLSWASRNTRKLEWYATLLRVKQTISIGTLKNVQERKKDMS